MIEYKTVLSDYHNVFYALRLLKDIVSTRDGRSIIKVNRTGRRPVKSPFKSSPGGRNADGFFDNFALQIKLIYRLMIDLGGAVSATVRRGANGEFWLDLASERGVVDLTLSAPSEGIEIRLSTDRYHNVYDRADAAEAAITAQFRNSTTRSRWCNYADSVADLEGRRVDRRTSGVHLPAGTSVERAFRPAITRLGFYKAVVSC